MDIFIGCSGFSYKDWGKKFYPEDLSRNKWLSYYAEHFNTVEIDNAFYKLPSQAQLNHWMHQTPLDFKFSIKAHRYLTHIKKLNADDSFLESLDQFQKTLNAIKDKIGCVLWQLPGNLHKDIPRLEAFTEQLDMGFNHVIEFRHESWFNEGVYDLLRDKNLTYCMLSAPNALPEDVVITSKVAYLRFHGKSTWYNYHYSTEELKSWKERLEALEGLESIYIYFNNDHHAHAVKNAFTLRELMAVEV